MITKCINPTNATTSTAAAATRLPTGTRLRLLRPLLRLYAAGRRERGVSIEPLVDLVDVRAAIAAITTTSTWADGSEPSRLLISCAARLTRWYSFTHFWH